MTEPIDTPPAAGQTTGAAPPEQPNVGPVSGNRTPMVVTLVVLGILVVAVMALVVASVLH